MNIALFPSSFAPHLGGVEELVRQLAHQLAADGHVPSVNTNRWPKDLPERENFEGLKVRRYAFRVPERTLKQYAGARLFGPSTLRKLCGDLAAERTDVLHVQCVSSNAYYALLARRRLGLPLVVTLQGELTMDAGGLFQRSEFARGLLRRAMSEADVVTACSGQTLADAEKFFGRRLGPKARVIFNGASATEFDACKPYEHPRPYIFAMGRLAPQKGFDVLIRAFVAAGIKSHDLLIAGDGSERANLEALVKSSPNPGSIHLIGRADRKQVASLLCGAGFFVLPSRSDEGFPVVCAEAMAAGKAIIATRSGGAPEAVVDGETGLIVEKEDATGLAGALRRLLVDPAMCGRFGVSGRQRSHLFAWPKVSRQYEAAYQDALQGRSRNHLCSVPAGSLSPS